MLIRITNVSHIESSAKAPEALIYKLCGAKLTEIGKDVEE